MYLSRIRRYTYGHTYDFKIYIHLVRAPLISILTLLMYSSNPFPDQSTPSLSITFLPMDWFKNKTRGLKAHDL